MGSIGFSGYSFRTWLSKNKDSIKNIVSLLLGIVGTSLNGLVQTKSVWWTIMLAGLFGSVSAAGSRLLLDAVDYFFTPDAQ